MLRHALLTAFLIVIFSTCNLPSAAAPTLDAVALSTMVAGTMQALTPVATPTLIPTFAASPTSLATPSITIAQVSGKVCYPKSVATDLIAYFQDTLTATVVELPIAAGLTQYSVELPPGTYIAYAWVTDFSIGGSYSACGQTPGCGDATPKTFSVPPGQKITGIDLCDWSHGPFDVPYPPGFQPAAQFGTIAGTILYPYGALPSLQIVAFSQKTPYWYWVGTAPGQAYFTIPDLPAGSYQIVAYDDAGHVGGSPVIVTVTGGGTASAEISDWSGSYPANPLK